MAVSTLEAPARMRGRVQAESLAMTLPADLPDSVIEVRFASGSWPTASFVDELVRAILVDRGAKMLVFVGADIVAAELASQSAASLGVAERLTFQS